VVMVYCRFAHARAAKESEMLERLCQFWGCGRIATGYTRFDLWFGMWHCCRHAPCEQKRRCKR
jgi:hypothetical protein